MSNYMDIQSELCEICESEDISVDTLRKKMKELCRDNLSSLDTLRDKIASLNPRNNYMMKELNEYPFFHKACLNKNVTLEVIRYLLDEFPDIEKVMWCYYGGTDIHSYYYDHSDNEAMPSYPLHLCCYNQYCPTSVIELLIDRYPSALSHYASIQFGFEGENDGDYFRVCPLMYYLIRETNLDIDTVKILIQACPQALLATNNGHRNEFTSLHAIMYNRHVGNLQHVLTYLLEAEPLMIQTVDGFQRSPLHMACTNESGGVTLTVVEFLFYKWPEAMRIGDSIYGRLPIHELCENKEFDDTTSLDILCFIISIDHTLVMARDHDGHLPIHLAAKGKSVILCKELIKTYPDSLRVRSPPRHMETSIWGGELPLHKACEYGNLEVVKYLLDLHPESVNALTAAGRQPIHKASISGTGRSLKVLDWLLLHYPSLAQIKTARRDSQLPLHLACSYHDGLHLQSVQNLYDTYPEATYESDANQKKPFDMAWECEVKRRNDPKKSKTVNFLLTQQAYAHQAQEIKAKSTIDNDDWLSLHCALKDNASLGSIKLLVGALRIAGHIASLSLNIANIACEFSSVKVVRYLIELDSITEEDLAFMHMVHSACRGGNLEVIKYFLDEYTALVSSAEVNEKGELPLHLLCEAGKDKVDIDSTEYTEIIWRMLLANPEAVVGA